MAARSKPKPFQLVGGDPCLDLINTLDNRFIPSGPDELLNGYDDLLRFIVQCGLMSERQQKKLLRLEVIGGERNRVLERLKSFREALAAVTYAQQDGLPLPSEALAGLEVFFKEAQRQRQLTVEGTSLLWTWPKLSRHLESPLWLLAHAAEELLTTPHVAHLRTCASDTCRWLFLDTSKNHTRRWCDMKVCGNRNKARVFQARSHESRSEGTNREQKPTK
jgi:predicted RNA-binding Zn ribbon-like protein